MSPKKQAIKKLEDHTIIELKAMVYDTMSIIEQIQAPSQFQIAAIQEQQKKIQEINQIIMNKIKII